MRNRRNKDKNFEEYCKKVWLYLELEMMVDSPKRQADKEDISFYYDAGNNVQTAAFLIKEMIT